MRGLPDFKTAVYAGASGTIASGTAAAVSLNTSSGGTPALYTVTFGYAVNPTNGNITIAQGGTTLLDMDILDTAVYHWTFPEGLYDPTSTSKIVVTLADGSQDKELNVTGRASSIT